MQPVGDIIVSTAIEKGTKLSILSSTLSLDTHGCKTDGHNNMTVEKFTHY